MKSLEDLLIKTAELLNEEGFDYIITGGMAVSVWGRPRSTLDVDVVIEINKSDIEGFVGAVKQKFPKGYVRKEDIERVLEDGGEFNVVDPESGAKIDFWISRGDLFSKSRFQRKIKETIKNTDIYFISPEDLILSKLLWYKKSQSEKQLEDVRSVIEIQEDNLNEDYLKKWIDELDLLETVQQVELEI